MRKVLGEDGVEWGIEEVDGGGGLFLVAAFNWEESLGPVAVICTRALFCQRFHTLGTRRGVGCVFSTAVGAVWGSMGRHRRSSLAEWALQGIEGRGECGLCVIGRRRCGSTDRPSLIFLSSLPVNRASYPRTQGTTTPGSRILTRGFYSVCVAP